MDFSMPNEEFVIKPSTIETVDTGFYEHVDDAFNIHTISNGGFIKVPVLWVGAERAFQAKSNQSIRDSSGKLILPLITIERTSMVKDPSFKGPIQADLRPDNAMGRGYYGGSFKVVSKINQEKTNAVQAAGVFQSNKQFSYPKTSRKIVYDEYLVPIPTYVSITYTLTLRSEYQQQMNQMLTPFITRTGQLNHFVFVKDNHKFEGFIQQDFAQNNNLSNMGEDERTFNTKVEIKVLGYLIGEGVNNEVPKITKRETLVTIRVAERVLDVSAEAEVCYKDVSIASISEEDKTVYKTKVVDPDTGLPSWRESELYEPGMGTLKLGVKSEERNVEVECEDEE